MSARYSLRQTPRKKALFDGMVETPKPRTRSRKSLIPGDSDAEGDSSSAESTKKTTQRRRLPKFVEHIDETDEDVSTSEGTPQPEEKHTLNKKTNGTMNGCAHGYTNGHANGYTNGHANGYANGHTNGHANGQANGHTNGYANGTNGHTNGHANGHANGHTNGDANGHTNGHANGHTNGDANGHTNGDANGHTNGHANGKTNGYTNGYVNGKTNGYTDGHANGTTNGHTNGHANGKLNGYTNGHANGKAVNGNGVAAERVVDGWMPGADHRIDYSGRYEFGGSLGVAVMIVFFPTLMWYMWIGSTFYNGSIPLPAPGESWADFGRHLVNLVCVAAFPSAKAWAMYWTFLIFEAACYCLMPGVWAYGKPLPHAGGKQLPYYCSAFVSFYFTIFVAFWLHVTGVFPLYTIIDEFGPLLSVAILSGFIVSIVAYFSAIWRGAQHRMSGSFLYDLFMGAELNPRMFGILDFKMFFEVRLPWFILFLLSCAVAARQYDRYGYVSGEIGFLVMAHYLYANACAKGEELIVTTWDIYYEKWGFMLIFWNLAGVPLSYCHCTLYLANHHPSEYAWSKPALIALYASYLFVYWVWDSGNSQKNRFRAEERGTLVPRNTFPQLPWQTLKNPKSIKTSTGDAILVDGWYGLARKLIYTCDAFFAICWGLITGFKSPFPWFYPVFFCLMIAHRAHRDIARCRLKYGDAWMEYEKRVPYLFIPYVV